MQQERGREKKGGRREKRREEKRKLTTFAIDVFSTFDFLNTKLPVIRDALYFSKVPLFVA
eukprot:15366834-Ditylum_brightwellii.AAC.1